MFRSKSLAFLAALFLLSAVRTWAESKGYVFAYPGTEGDDGVAGAAPTGSKYEPVALISWRDCVVWCNAYSEKSGYAPCYSYNGSAVRDATSSTVDAAVCSWSANGYRLPTEGEWQYAASDRGGGRLGP